MREKTLSNVEETVARCAQVIAVVPEANAPTRQHHLGRAMAAHGRDHGEGQEEGEGALDAQGRTRDRNRLVSAKDPVPSKTYDDAQRLAGL
jgi:hypothetical protein